MHEVGADKESTVKGQDGEQRPEQECGEALYPGEVKVRLSSLSTLFCWAQAASVIRMLSMMAAEGMHLPAVVQRANEDEGATVLVYDCRPQPHEWQW